MSAKKWAGAVAAIALLAAYNGAQPSIYDMRSNPTKYPGTRNKTEGYGASMEWLDRAMGRNSQRSEFAETKLDFRILSSMMVAGLASGFRSQVANLLWMKFDEYFHEGQVQRQIPIMEAVVTLDPTFIDAWDTIGWHWAYNIYADVPEDPKFKGDPLKIRREQERCVALGLDYLNRGANANPDTYKLWFSQAMTRANKAGMLDETTFRLFDTARAQKDARLLKRTDYVNGKPVDVYEEGMDVVGHMKTHIYEQIPDLPAALNLWGQIMQANKFSAVSKDQLKYKITPENIRLLREAGRYWGLYGTHYNYIVDVYRSPDSDATIKARVKALVPDIEEMLAAQKAREHTDKTQPTPTGAYITLVARYWPTWQLWKQGNTKEAVRTIIGVMNAEPKYHLQKLPVLAKVLEIRGDSPEAIQKIIKESQETERSSSQEIGLHLLGLLYEDLGRNSKGAEQKAYYKQAYETWYRARVRDALDFYAQRNTYLLEDKFGFTPPQKIIDEINASRKRSQPFAAPPPPKD